MPFLNFFREKKRLMCLHLLLTLFLVIAAHIYIGVHASLKLNQVLNIDGHWLKFTGNLMEQLFCKRTLMKSFNESFLPTSPPPVWYSFMNGHYGLELIGHSLTSYIKIIHMAEFRKSLKDLALHKFPDIIEDISVFLHLKPKELLAMIDSPWLIKFSEKLEASTVQNLLHTTPANLADIAYGLTEGTVCYFMKILTSPELLVLFFAACLTLHAFLVILITLCCFKTFFIHRGLFCRMACPSTPVICYLIAIIVLFHVYIVLPYEQHDVQSKIDAFFDSQNLLNELARGGKVSPQYHRAKLFDANQYANILRKLFNAILHAESLLNSDNLQLLILGGPSSWVDHLSFGPLTRSMADTLSEFDLSNVAESLGSLMSHQSLFQTIKISFGNEAGKNDINWLFNLRNLKDIVNHLASLIFNDSTIA